MPFALPYRWTAAMLLGIALVLPARAQSDDDAVVPTVTHTYAIENARVVRAPGDVLEGATVIVRDGLILAVGSDVDVPFDAERIAGDSLVVYAGFIDALGHAGVPKPKPNPDRERPGRPGEPPNDVAGIQPERDVRTMLKPDDKSVGDLRELGFGAAHVVPHGGMLPGSGALVLLAGDSPEAMVLRGDASLYAQFEGGRRVYPSTPMGVMAKMRQLYREAERRKRLETRYASNATGIERPQYDPVHYAFFPVIDGTKPIVFYAEAPLEVHRALALQEALGFPLIVAGAQGGMDAVGALTARETPVFFSLDLPEDKKPSKKKDAVEADTTVGAEMQGDEPMTPEDNFVSDFRTFTYEDLDAEKENLEARQAIVRKQHYALAAELEEAGLPFAFSTRDVKAKDIRKNLRLMIENGLTEDGALAALTTSPARILGLSQSLGTVEKGKIANLVVTTGPYFDEDSAIRFVFVDGQKFELDAKPKKKASAADGEGLPVAAAGTWSYALETPNGTADGTITITGTPGSLSGVITSSEMEGETPLIDVELDGDVLTFSFEAPGMGTITTDLTISGDEISGTMSVGEYGGFPVTGTRISGPEH